MLVILGLLQLWDNAHRVLTGEEGRGHWQDLGLFCCCFFCFFLPVKPNQCETDHESVRSSPAVPLIWRRRSGQLASAGGRHGTPLPQPSVLVPTQW